MYHKWYTTGVDDLRIRNMDAATKKAFKLACVEEGISMNRKVIELIEKYLKRRGKLKK